jgi:hypothetical protein
MVKCPICGMEANDIDSGLFDGAGFDCNEHGPFRVSGTVLSQSKERTRAQWENALASAKRRASQGERPLITTSDFKSPSRRNTARATGKRSSRPSKATPVDAPVNLVANDLTAGPPTATTPAVGIADTRAEPTDHRAEAHLGEALTNTHGQMLNVVTTPPAHAAGGPIAKEGNETNLDPAPARTVPQAGSRATMTAIEAVLATRPADIRDAARALSQEFTSEMARLQKSRPNDPDRLPQHDDLIALFEKMARGLAALADALDAAVKGDAQGKPEPIFLGKAAQAAQWLQGCLVEWLEKNRTKVIDVPLRIGVFGLGVSFLSSIGADSLAAIGALVTLILKR